MPTASPIVFDRHHLTWTVFLGLTVLLSPGTAAAADLPGEQIYRVPSLPLPPAEGVGGWTLGVGEQGSAESPNAQRLTPDALSQYEAVTLFAEKLKSRCAVLLRQDEREQERKRERLPCNLKIEILARAGKVNAAVYEISMEGILVSGPEAEKLPLCCSQSWRSQGCHNGSPFSIRSAMTESFARVPGMAPVAGK